MLSIRTGWPRNEVKRLTINEARLTLEELDRIDDAEEARLIEAQHRPNALYERSLRKPKKSKKDEKDPLAGWKQGLSKAATMKGIGTPGPDKARLLDQEIAVIRFLEQREKNKRGR